MTLSLFRSGGMRALVSPFLAILFWIAFNAVRGVFEMPSLQILGQVQVLWVAVAGFAAIELVWPSVKDGLPSQHSPVVRLVYAIVLGLGFGGIGYGCLSVAARLAG